VLPYSKRDYSGALFIAAGCLYFFWWFYIRWLILQGDAVNHIICDLEFGDQTIKLETCSVTLFLGIFRRKPITIEGAAINELLLREPRAGRPFKNKYLRNAYTIVKDGKGYYLVEIFFDDFSGLLSRFRSG
jgi:hypothetical protein